MLKCGIGMQLPKKCCVVFGHASFMIVKAMFFCFFGFFCFCLASDYAYQLLTDKVIYVD